MTLDLYVWKAPRDLDVEAAQALVQRWQAAGGDPGASPFEPSSDVGWFARELTMDAPGLEVTTDAIPNPSRTPIWLTGTPEPPARVVGIRLSPGVSAEVIEAIVGLAGKYDLVLFDAQNTRLHLPLEEMAAHASATFWPAGAVQAAVAGGIGGAIGVAAWSLGIPIVSGALAIVGGFMFVMAVFTFVHEGRKAISTRRSPDDA